MNNSANENLTFEQVREQVTEQTLDALSRCWRTEPKFEGEQECIQTTYTIAGMIEEMVDADLDTINAYMLRRGFHVTMDELGVLGWMYYSDDDPGEEEENEENSALGANF